MKLYHGTTSRLLKKILADGIRPRGKRKSIWAEYPSRTDMVYLSTAYPLYFAMNAAEDGELSLILEIDSDLLDQGLLYPDEDFVAQVYLHQGPPGMELSVVHKHVRRRLKQWRHLWVQSIEGMGNCCYRGTIPASAITRYCLFDAAARPAIAMMAMDPSISIMNYKFCKGKYLSLMAWLFGDQEIIETESFPTIRGVIDANPEISKIMRDREEYWKQESANREGVEVYENT
ncbi:MAG: hypothetical protein M0R80_07730 [Proteobacteria bacterium]|jgi:hypothetical protein|nr:hypothetical protein [Pseudomonadota bacterium]